MDHAEEQQMEIQALEAIYMDDFKRLEDANAGGIATFEVTLVPEAGADETVNHISVAMQVAYDLRSDTHAGTPPIAIIRFMISEVMSLSIVKRVGKRGKEKKRDGGEDEWMASHETIWRLRAGVCC